MNGNKTEIPSYQHDKHNGIDDLLLNETEDTGRSRPTNEYVLNIAFVSFLGFMMLQAVFALAVGSQSMLADCEAMGVDAMTYLFNLCAERIKRVPYTQKELQLSTEDRDHARKLKRLYLELIPPLISVTTLIAVTVVTLRDSVQTLFDNNVTDAGNASEDEKAGVMLFFSGLNLVLDVVNVTCFARADQAFGLSVIQSTDEFRKSVRSRHDLSLLLPPESYEQESSGIELHETKSVDETSEESFSLVNLNMCSAWTHVCADTMRSMAVLVAAAIAFLFDAVSADVADAWAAVVVSFIIMFSLVPLLQGLFLTAVEIVTSSRRHPSSISLEGQPFKIAFSS